MGSYRAVAGLGVDREQLLDFFLTFARFEYALKAAGFFRPRTRRRTGSAGPQEYPDAEPDWPRFARSIRSAFRSDANPQLSVACRYLFDYPPYREVVAGADLRWETRAPHDDQSEVDRVLLYVRWVRNNLFHGGKFSPAHGGPTRNVALISHSLVILSACLALSPNVKGAYESAAL